MIPMAIRFVLTDGTEPHIEFPLGAEPFDGRRSRSGRVVIRFPAPFQHIEITEGQRIGPGKWNEIRRACYALGATIKTS